MIAREIVNKISFLFDPSGLQKAQQAIAGVQGGVASFAHQAQNNLLTVGVAATSLEGKFAHFAQAAQQSLMHVGTAATTASPAVKKTADEIGKASDQVKKLDKDTEALQHTIKNFLTLFTAGALYNGIKHMVEGAVHLSSSLSDTAAQFGVSTDALQRFQYAALVTGVKTEQFNAALGPLSRQIFAAGEGSKSAAQLFTKFGIAIRDNKGQLLPTEEVIGNIADQVAKLKSPAEQAGLAMKFFGRAGAKLVPILKGGRAGLRQAGLELDNLGGPIIGDTVESLATLGDRIDAVEGSFDRLKATIVGALAPGITWTVDKIGSLIGFMKRVVETSMLAQTAFMALSGTIAFFALRALISMAPVLLPILAIGAAITGLVLLYEDLWVTLKGGDSLLSRFVNWCHEAKDTATGLAGVIAKLGDKLFHMYEIVYDFMHPDEKALEKSVGVLKQDINMNDVSSLDRGTVNGQQYERRRDKKFFGLADGPEYWVPAGGNAGGNSISGAGTIGGASGGGGVMQTNDVKIEVHPTSGMNEEAVAIHTKRVFDAEMSKTIKNARAAALPSVAGAQ